MSATVIPMPGAAPARRGVRWGRVFLWLFAGGLALGALLVIVVVASFWPSGEVRAVRDIALAAAPGQWERQVEFGVGRLPTWVAKKALAFADLEPEARLAIQAFRGADVAVYERVGAQSRGKGAEGGGAVDDRAARMSDEVRSLMEDRGWESVVQVQDKGELVGVFMPKSEIRGSEMRVCVVVMDRSDLVIASARIDAEPLVELAVGRGARWQLARRD